MAFHTLFLSLSLKTTMRTILLDPAEVTSAVMIKTTFPHPELQKEKTLPLLIFLILSMPSSADTTRSAVTVR